PLERPVGDTSALLSTDRYVLHTDGRVIGQRPANWNWGFARSLLDVFFPDVNHPAIGSEADRVFAADWYHAVAAYMFANGRHRDLKKFLSRAADALADDQHVLFDRACFAETLGLPVYQVLPSDPGYVTPGPGHMLIEVPPEEKTDGEAERLFRR